VDAPVRSLERRYWRDADVWHVLAVALVVLVATAGVPWLVSLAHCWRVARSAPTRVGAVEHALVFGKRLVAGAPDADLALRLDRALALVAAGDTRSLVLLGGRGPAGDSEARVAHAALRRLGLDEAVEVAIEDESADTLENLRHARPLLGTAARIALVSNRYHLPRIGQLARQLGMPHVLCAAEDAWSWRRLPALLHESLLVFTGATGTRWARLIRSERLLARVS
jgi:uncharacterized SAM-binding protein YcdF (DUF218 family)